MDSYESCKRTTSPEIVEKQPFDERSRADCHTQLSHNHAGELALTLSNRSIKPTPDCSTRVSHNRYTGMWLRGAIYQYRVRVPADLRAVVGTTHVSRSLRTASLTVARRLAKIAAYDMEQRFEAARAARQWPLNDSLRTEVATEPRVGCAPFSRHITFGKATELYLTDPTISRSPKSQIVYRTTFATIAAILGKELPLQSVTRDACRDVLGVLQRLPPNVRKRWPNRSPIDIAEEAQERDIPPMSSANCNEYMNKLSSFLNWAVREEMLHRNPARGLRIADGRLAREKRHPFSVEQLQAIFDAPIYRGCKDDEHGYSLVDTSRPRRARFWIPLVALWSGLRQGEICQMLTDDVREIDGVWCFVVSAAEGEGKRLKTAASERLVPIHAELQEIGFKGYVAARRAAGDHRLFPDLGSGPIDVNVAI